MRGHGSEWFHTERIKNIYAENMKKNVEAFWELPAK